MLQVYVKVVMAFLMGLFCWSAVAGAHEDASVTGAGHVALQPKATALRFRLTLTAFGDDMESTLKSIAHKGEAFRKALLAAKATPESIRVSTPRLIGGLRALGDLIPSRAYWRQGGKGDGKQQRQLQTPKHATKGGKRQTSEPAPDDDEAPAPERRGPRIELSAQLVADWPLHGDSQAQLLVEGDEIVRRAYKQMRSLFPAKDSDEPEAESSYQQTGETLSRADHPDFTRPMYVFVGVLSESELQEADAKAFKAATADAAATAKIAGLQIGDLLTLNVSGHGADTDPFEETARPIIPAPPAVDDSPFDPFGPARVASAAKRHGAVEVTSHDPSSLQHVVTVNATFRLPSSGRPTPENK